MNLYRTLFPLTILCLFLSACSKKPKPINYGQDNCDFCQMTISDSRFGGEIITQKGRVYKFDDLHCLRGFLRDNRISAGNVYQVLLVDFSHPGKFILAEQSFLLENESLESPMGSATAAFNTEEELKTYQNKYSGKEQLWKDYLKGK